MIGKWYYNICDTFTVPISILHEKKKVPNAESNWEYFSAVSFIRYDKSIESSQGRYAVLLCKLSEDGSLRGMKSQWSIEYIDELLIYSANKKWLLWFEVLYESIKMFSLCLRITGIEIYEIRDFSRLKMTYKT